MSRVDELLRILAPSGVEFKPLGDVGTFVRGNGLQKVDLRTEGSPAIHYGQVHTYYGTWADATKSFVDPILAARLRRAKPGDLIVATTSEDVAAVAKATAWLGSGEVAISGDAYVYSHTLDPRYVSYFFQSQQFQDQKKRRVTGTKVRRISGDALARIVIPVPPLDVQREIAKILDELDSNVSFLTTATGEELAARRDQYAYYSDLLLTGLHTDDESWTTLGELYTSSSGLSKSADQFGFGHPFLSFKTVFRNAVVPTELTDLVNSTEVEQARFSIKAGDVFVTRTSEDLEGLGTSCAALRDYPRATFNGFTKRLRPKEASVVDPQFAAYFFRSSLFRSQISRMAILSTRVSLNNDILRRVRMPLPLIEEQRRVVAKLVELDTLSSELAVQIRAEVTARRDQLTYYRDSLFKFEELAS
ncbi:restriction endonuclease subunit S [Microbacterium rhizosphaerae]|uniref:Restriction endonuclease subunit S n=1 Tax=Microbacterium rhizosphaerae TaxID=1678237 RepID=A0ABZ0ST44_9MICO|nr:restriction endonuclease subunit S [Microbacterium rhizosphaerae]WPR91340.1 restriction endonuclease subunit S [Microbacterium rhizosphaerae]